MNHFYNTCTSFFNICCDLITPYKHITVESVKQDTDIENQYERITKIVVIGSSNVFVNLLMKKIELIKIFSKNSKIYIQYIIKKYYTKDDSIVIVEHEEDSDNKKKKDE